MDVKGAKALSERLAAATQTVDARLAAMSAPADLCSDSHETESSSPTVDAKVQRTSC